MILMSIVFLFFVWLAARAVYLHSQIGTVIGCTYLSIVLALGIYARFLNMCSLRLEADRMIYSKTRSVKWIDVTHFEAFYRMSAHENVDFNSLEDLRAKNISYKNCIVGYHPIRQGKDNRYVDQSTQCSVGSWCYGLTPLQMVQLLNHWRERAIGAKTP